jgi:hypothetical protein
MATSTGAIGFLFEDLVKETISKVLVSMSSAGWKTRILGEQEIRDQFGEQSLNGVDHMVEIEDPVAASVTIILIQEKWKIITNQREVSQFLDCCARILSRIRPERRTIVHRLWVTRSQPSVNGEKSLLEGGAHIVQSMTSQNLLAQITAQYICDLVGNRAASIPMIETMGSFISSSIPDDPVILDNSKTATAASKCPYKMQVNVCKE